MTLSKFKQYCEQKQPHIITYNDENDREYTAAGGSSNHFEALRLVLAFDSVTVEYNPNVIYFKGDCGVMYINNVQCVSVNSGCMLGDIVTVTAGTSNGQRKYTLLFNDSGRGVSVTPKAKQGTPRLYNFLRLESCKNKVDLQPLLQSVKHIKI